MTVSEHAPARLRRAPAEKAALAVLPACAGVWTAAEIMHAMSVPGLDIGLGAAVLAAGAGVTGHRATATGLLIAGAWTAAAVKFGPLAGPALYYPVTWGWAVLSFCGWRWAATHPNVTAARDRRNARAGWLAKRNNWGLGGTHLLEHEPTRLGERYLVDVRGSGKRASQIANSDVAERIAESYPSPLPPGRVRVRRHRLAGRIEISVRHEDPWAKPIPHPAVTPGHEIDLSGPYSIARPAVVGQDPETGRPLELLLCGPGGGRNVSIVAMLDSGKTTLLSCISERVTAARDALLVRINLSIKGDQERDLWGPACHLTAFGPRETGRAVKVLRVIAGIVEWRAGRPKMAANWQPSPADPLLVLSLDEIDALAEIPACKHLLKHLASKGREYGVTIVRAGQRGTAEWTGGADVRSQDAVFVIGRVNRAMEAMHAAGDLGLQLPNMAEYGENQPGVWAVAELDGRHEAGRGFDLSGPGDIRELVRQRAHYQPDLQPELKTFLGETYENLLGTDVYARWARGQAPRPAVAHPRPDMEPEPVPFPAGLDPLNPLHFLAVLDRDDEVQADDDTADALAQALDIHERQQAALDALDKEADDHMAALGDDDLHARWIKQGEKLAETRRLLEETGKTDIPDIPHDALVAHAEAQWHALGLATEIPEDARGPLLRLLAGGTTISEVAKALGVSKWTARTYLERLRAEGRVRIEGEKRTARWLLNETDGGDES